MSPSSRLDPDIEFPSKYEKFLVAVVVANPNPIEKSCLFFARFLRKAAALGVVDACWAVGGVEEGGERVVKLVE